MKKFTLLFCALFATTFLLAQNKSYEKEVTMSMGNQNAYVLDLDEINVKDAEKYWQEYFKEVDRLKKNRKADQLYAEGVKIPIVSDDVLDVYSKVEDLQGNSRLYVWVDNQGAFLSSKVDADASKSMLQYLNDFAVEAEKKHVEELLNQSENDLSDLEKDLKRLERDKETYEKNIEKAKETIVENEDKIVQNKTDQETKAVEIDAQKAVVEKIKERLQEIGKSHSKL